MSATVFLKIEIYALKKSVNIPAAMNLSQNDRKHVEYNEHTQILVLHLCVDCGYETTSRYLKRDMGCVQCYFGRLVANNVKEIKN